MSEFCFATRKATIITHEFWEKDHYKNYDQDNVDDFFHKII